MTATGADTVQPSAVDEQEFAALRDEIRAYVDDAGARWASGSNASAGCRRSCGTTSATAAT